MFSMVSCVTQKKYNDLFNKYMNTQVDNASLNKNIDSIQQALLQERANLRQSIAQMKTDSMNLVNLLDNMKSEIDALNKAKQNLEAESAEKLNQANLENQKTNAELIQLQMSLEQQKLMLDKKEKELALLASNLSSQQEKIDLLEKLLNEQKTQSELLKNNILKAMTNIDAGDLEVTTKDGKVYVMLSNKLMFASGSTVVESKGIEALGKLASVLQKNPDIMINVEGHTDNVKYLAATTGCIQDNWDLSLMRASSVLHILTEKYFVSRLQLTASGKGEFSPKATNITPEGKAQNRRTEIILTPKIDKIMELLNDK